MRSARTTAAAVAAAVALLVAGCAGDDGAGASACGFTGGARCRPDNARVDLGRPEFSRPTAITNRLFPISATDQVVFLGEEGGQDARIEVTRLPETRTITWDGRRVPTVRSQFVAYAEGRIVEVAVDHFAQADDGSVWYFGEDVRNYEKGLVADHDGTWLAGRDGPPAVIMPAAPARGDVFRPENIPGLVFEEDEVVATDRRLAGPRGPISGGVAVRERLMEGSAESKVYAPGYGEFEIRAEDEHIVLAVAAPTDRRGPRPAELQQLVDVAGGPDGLSAALDRIRPDLPPRLADALDRALAAVRADPTDKAASIRLSLAAVDLLLLHQPVAEVDAARIAVWARQAELDAETADRAGLASDVAIMEAIRARSRHAMSPVASAQVDEHLAAARRAASGP